jgi:hypothetical protein
MTYSTLTAENLAIQINLVRYYEGHRFNFHNPLFISIPAINSNFHPRRRTPTAPYFNIKLVSIVNRFYTSNILFYSKPFKLMII